MSKKSAGILLYREAAGRLEVLLVHPGGPFWAGKDEGAWSIPKGEFEDVEEPLVAARREFEEEIGMAVDGDFIPLEPLRQPGGKMVFVWAVQGDFDPAQLKSNTFPMEWPLHSGRRQEFPEVDRAAWLPIEAAIRKIVKGQMPFLLQFQEKLNDTANPSGGSAMPSR